jgi:hypothetical protein
MSNPQPGPTGTNSKLPADEARSPETTGAERVLENPLAGGDAKKQAQSDQGEPQGLAGDGTPQQVMDKKKTLPAKLAALK